ncbi:apelin receptor early endogenous ligand isoform X2 [Corythoichthys intestinalis]|uniref:apelin receptor early endogenous ligand isoform X2 n=1 Tax=Corythoichthys intestinalis TaxID=161448 RepID=UPI0025A54C00|nr:apelin receptor early endogenous ligand isoform X2 [Corythoichthys intestinalis]
MRIFNLLYLLLLILLVATVVLVEAASINRPNFQNMRKKYHRHFCLHRRCLPLHSRVPFP